MPARDSWRSWLASLLASGLLAGCGDALPNSPNGPPPHERVTVRETPNERGRLERIHGQLVLFTQGTPYEEGYQHGNLLKDELQGFYHDYYQQHVFPALPVMPEFWHAWSARSQAAEYTPEERAEIRGLADGSGLSEDQILIMQANPPWCAPATWFRSGMAGRLSFGTAAFALSGGATLGHVPLLGMDMAGFDADVRHRYTLLQVHHPDRGYAFVVPTVPGRVMDGAGGWNERGLVLAATEGPMRWQNASGVPSGLLTRRLIQGCGTLEEVERGIRSVRRRSLQGLILIAANRSGAQRFDVAQSISEAWQGRDRVVVRPASATGLLLASHARNDSLALEGHLQASYGRIDVTKALQILVDTAAHTATESFSLGPWPLAKLGATSLLASTLCDLDHDRLYVALDRAQVESPAQFTAFDMPSLLMTAPGTPSHKVTGTVAARASREATGRWEAGRVRVSARRGPPPWRRG
jgi:hypothetical protein